MEEKIKAYIEFEKYLYGLKSEKIKDGSVHFILLVEIDEKNYEITTTKTWCSFEINFGQVFFKDTLKKPTSKDILVPKKSLNSGTIEFVSINECFRDIYYSNPLNLFCVSKFFFRKHNNKTRLWLRDGEFTSIELDIFRLLNSETEFRIFQRSDVIYSNYFEKESFLNKVNEIDQNDFELHFKKVFSGLENEISSNLFESN